MQGALRLAGRVAWPSWAQGLAGVSAQALAAQRGALFPWLAVFFGIGIGIYLSLRDEPGTGVLLAVALGGLAAAALVRPLGPVCGPLAVALAVTAAGFDMAALRTRIVAAPILEFRYHGPVEGRIVHIDVSASEATRLTLDRVVLANVPPERTPRRVRISLQREQPWLDPEPGMVVVVTAGLMPPNGPAEPGGFDFRLPAFFGQLGAVGYTATPVLLLEPPAPGLSLVIERLRMRLSARILALVPGDAGGLASAIITGDRSGLSNAATEAMRDANLYHIVSISGTHMSMLVGLVFALVRASVALVPPLALRLDGRKVAALVALPVAIFYMLLSGRDMATERAFIMAAVMLGAVLLDRRALSMRSVAFAALIVLGLRPEALLNAGFQMSFAAVVALIAAYGAIAGRQPSGRRWRWIGPTLMLVFSSLVAGLATAPYGAAQFSRLAHYGLIANLLAVPVMGAVAMPATILLLLLSPLGIVEPARSLAEWSCYWMIYVSERVAALDGAASSVVAPPNWLVPVMTLAGLVLALWQGRGRWLGAAALVLVFAGWAMVERPALLVSSSGGIVGVMEDGMRALSRPEGEAFVATNWLRRDGSSGAQADATEGFTLSGRRAEASVAGLRVLALRGTRELGAVRGCDGADILVVSVEVPDRADRPCLVLDEPTLRQSGAVAGWPQEDGVLLVATDWIAGRRPWLPAGRGRDPTPEPFLMQPGVTAWP